ncbi:MAG: nucleotidyltransferase family protein [Myxococcaceae bacterium]
MKAVVLCAGLGTRLRPFTSRWPKPAMPLLGQPLLRYSLAVLARGGVTAVGVNTHHLPGVMEDTASAECERLGLPLTVVHEPVIQGTGGGIRSLRELVDDGPFIVLNGDVLFSVELRPLIAAHQASGAAATMVLLPMPAGEKYAAVELDGARTVRRIAGHGPGGGKLTPWHFTGVHLLTPAVFDFMRPGGPEDINRDVYPRLLEAGLPIRGEVLDPSACYWSDLGTPARYAGTHRDLLFGQVGLLPFAGSSPFDGAGPGAGNFRAHPSATLRDVKVSGPAFFAEGCELGAGVHVGAAVSVGKGARVGAGARLNRVAVLDGGRVLERERLEDCLVGESDTGERWVVPTPAPRAA